MAKKYQTPFESNPKTDNVGTYVYRKKELEKRVDELQEELDELKAQVALLDGNLDSEEVQEGLHELDNPEIYSSDDDVASLFD